MSDCGFISAVNHKMCVFVHFHEFIIAFMMLLIKILYGKDQSLGYGFLTRHDDDMSPQPQMFSFPLGP